MRVVNPLVPGAFGTSVGPASRRLTSIRYSSPDQSPRFDLLCPEPVASTPELTVRHRNHAFFSARKQQSLRVLERGWPAHPVIGCWRGRQSDLLCRTPTSGRLASGDGS